jgi:hypothetical protein
MTPSNSYFIDESEWFHYHQSLLTGVQTIITTLAKHQPAALLSVVSGWIQTCIVTAVQASATMKVSVKREYANTSGFISQWSSHTSVLSVTLKQLVEVTIKSNICTIQEQDAPNVDVVQLNVSVHSLLESFLDWQPTDYSLRAAVG